MLQTSYSETVERTRKVFNKDVTKSVEFRVIQLKALLRLFNENEDLLLNAIQQDTCKPKHEAVLLEIEYIKNAIRGALHNINKWIQPQPTERNLVLLFDKTFVINQPYGVVLIIGAWNYPLQLTISPLVGAIAAGNCAIVKPSENSPATSKLLHHLVPRYLDVECYHVVTGGVEETTALLKERFDYIFYTGSPVVGQKIRDAANKYLTPVTLELGGKSPVYVDESVDLYLACKRILWGKLLNLGQTCVSPDYVLCTKEVQEKFIVYAKPILKEFFGEDPSKSPDLARIVSEQHFKKLCSYLQCGRIALGGQYCERDRFFAPTILTDVSPSDPVMQDEIFGPILPLVTVSGPDDAIALINMREKPLTMYVFTAQEHIMKKFLITTSSGSMCINDTVVHLSIDALPFGGVGMSGMGQYHGKYSFDTFSHKKAVLVRSYNILGEKIGQPRYPPYSEGKMWYLKKLLQKRPSLIPSFTPYILVFVFGMISAFFVKEMLHATRMDSFIPNTL